MRAPLCALFYVLLGASALFGSACASSPKAEPKAAPSSASANAAEACTSFANTLCSELGNDSEACMALRSVSEWLPEESCVAGNTNIDDALARIATLRAHCDELMATICAQLGEDSATCAEVKRDLPEVPAGHCRALLAHRDELLGQLRAREERSKPLSPELWAELLADGAPSFGPANAKVTIALFSDFECPYCSRAKDTVHRLRETFGDKVRVSFRHFPLPFHENARPAALASVAAQAQGKFWEYHDLLFAAQDALSAEDLARHAKELGLDLVAFEAALKEPSTAARVDADVALGRKARVDGTPSMFIDGKRVPNPTDFDEVATLVEAALAAP